MSKITCYDSEGNPMTQLYQWDLNQSIKIKGYDGDEVPVFHFCHKHSQLAIPVSPTDTGDGLVAMIPNELLQKAESLDAYLYIETADEGAKSVHVCTIPVFPRPKPADYVYEKNVDYISLVALDARVTALSDELIDIRLGIDGIMYSSAGDAVRTTIAHLVDDIADLQKRIKVLEEN